ncbi:MAG: hypothetical protein A2Y73_08935 [Chloroflexi bacterium RBG_13_56_8]|nr:MAG: hypothetical protein A2Y73_08935 [Chloroflexi bacterium RBG_13_56_8]
MAQPHEDIGFLLKEPATLLEQTRIVPIGTQFLQRPDPLCAVGSSLLHLIHPSHAATGHQPRDPIAVL